MLKTINYIFLILAFAPSFAIGQLIEQNSISQSNANQSIELGNFAEAVRQFKGLSEKSPNNKNHKYQLGIAYTFSNIDQAKGLSLLKELRSTDEAIDGLDMNLAIAYFKNYQFNEAIRIFESIEIDDSSVDEKTEISDWIKQCKNSLALYSKPIPITFENLGKTINSNSPDYYPQVSSDESLIIFSTRRSGVVGNLFDFGGYRTADIFSAKHKGNKYSRARSIGNPNTYGNEETAGTSENSKFMIYHVDSDDSYSDLFVSEKGRRSFMPPGKLNSNLVNGRSSEPGASITNDGNTLIFCSDRDGGFGGFDLYMVRRLPNLEWSEPFNLGEPINTSGDEKFPHIRDNGNELYFSSNGHEGMGDLDLFKSVSVDNKWTLPVNLGYPLNTVNDDPSISFAENKRYGYVATKRDDSFGDLDIYRVTFLREKEELTLINASMKKSDSSKVLEEIIVEILNDENGELYGSYISNKNTGNFIALLPPGKYSLEIFDAENYEDISIPIILNDKNDFIPKKTMNLILKEKKKTVIPALKNTPEIEE